MVFVLVIAFAIPTKTHAAQVFSDVPTTHIYYNEITYLLEKNVISKSGKYGVTDIVTREEVAVMVAKAVGLEGTQRTTKFSDVPKSNKNSGYIQSAVEAGIINGYIDGSFKPNTKVTRGHMAAFIARAFDLPVGSKTFKDVPVGHTAYEAVKQLAAAGITTGYTDGTFKPQENLSRAHIAVFIARAMQYAEDGGASTSKVMKVHFIDVGQGDSILVQAPNGKTMLIDGGVRSAGNKVVAYIKSLGINKLDYVVATHPDADHIGGLIAVLNSISIGEFINSGKEHTTATYEQMLRLVLEKNIKYTEPKTGDLITLDKDLKVQVLYADAIASDSNDASIVLKATYNKVSFLLTGDADKEIESEIAGIYDVQATILKAGHHGSNTSSSLAFLQKVKPNATILSYGKENSYGHPHDEVVANLKKVGSKMYSTAQEGTIIVTTNGNTYDISAKEFEEPITPTPEPEPTPNPPPVEYFKNCTELKKVYPNGVKRGHPAYQEKMDADKDGHACER